MMQPEKKYQYNQTNETLETSIQNHHTNLNIGTSSSSSSNNQTLFPMNKFEYPKDELDTDFTNISGTTQYVPENSPQDFYSSSKSCQAKHKRKRSLSPSKVVEFIRFKDLKLTSVQQKLILEITPLERCEELLNCPQGYSVPISLVINKEQANAVAALKKRLRAEKKSRREKRRRVTINSLIDSLAHEIGVDSHNCEIATILTEANQFIEKQRVQIQNLKEKLAESNIGSFGKQ